MAGIWRQVADDEPIPASVLAAVNREYVDINEMAFLLPVLEAAQNIEQYTQQVYLTLLEEADDHELANLYRRLGTFEEEHERLFRQRLEKEQNKSHSC